MFYFREILSTALGLFLLPLPSYCGWCEGKGHCVRHRKVLACFSQSQYWLDETLGAL